MDYIEREASLDPEEDEEEFDEEAGENADAANGKKKRAEDFDSSEEEDDEDDEEEALRVREGFIVDDEDEDDDEDGATVKVKRRKKRRRSHREEEEEDVLDEEDLDLVMENTGEGGRDNKSKFKRLKRGREEQRGRQESRGLNDIFSDDELDAPGDLDDDEREMYGGNNRRGDEFDDFIENDSSDDEDRRMGSGDERISRRRGAGRQVDPETLGLRAGAMNDMEDIFGLADYEDALVMADEAQEMEERTHDLQLKDVFEPSELQERLLTDEDNIIRNKDIPERFQLIRKPFENLEVSAEELHEEGTWIAHSLISKKRIDPDLEEPFIEAVRNVLRFLVVDNYEVPFISHQRKDYMIHAVKAPNRNFREGEPEYTLLSQRLIWEKDCWGILDLDLKFRAFLEKRNSFKKTYNALRNKMGIPQDPMVEERLKQSTMPDQIQDLTDYLHFQYHTQLKDLQASDSASRGHRRPGAGKTKFERIRLGRVYGLVRAFGITAEQFARNVEDSKKREFAEDPNRLPDVCADDYLDNDFPTSQNALLAAKQMLAEEIVTNPRMRNSLRVQWFTQAVIHVNVTEKGVKQIDEQHQYYEFKYLKEQGLPAIAGNPARYLKMLKAESDGLVELVFELQETNRLTRDLYEYITSENYSEIAEAWNRERKDVVDIALKKFAQIFTKSLRDELRTACEDEIANAINEAYGKRLDQAPYKSKHMEEGETPRVFAFSNGHGEFGRDAIVGVFTDEYGKAVYTLKVDDLRNDENRQKVSEAIRARNADVIGVSGFSVQTNRLYEDLIKLVEEHDLTLPDINNERQPIDVVFVNDEVARLYQHSDRAKTDHPDLAPLLRYCAALGRYMQSPMHEYAALGKDIVSIAFHPAQNLLSDERIMKSLESAMVDTVNLCGVNVNDAVRDPYKANLLPYVSGLGPRKKDQLIKSISATGGRLVTRDQLMGDFDKGLPQIFGPKVFENCASFLIISYDNPRDQEYLDSTRVHPEAYDLGRKMAADALDFDEEDVIHLTQTAGKGAVINKLINGNAYKLNELILEEYAEELERNFNQRKRATLETIRAELRESYEELRARYRLMSVDEIFTMLTGETKDTLDEGMVVAVKIRRVTDRYVSARLDCGIEGNVSAEEMPMEALNIKPSHYYHVGQTVQARIESLSRKTFYAELSLREEKIRQPRRAHLDALPHEWDDEREEKDKARLAITNQEQTRTARVIKHPLFKPFNSRQAEEFLAGRSRGDAVIRPSSNGPDHIAVTWKVGDGIYQHIDVLELDKANEFTVGKTLRVAGKYSYSDLDELIVNHVKNMARKIDELCNNGKFQAGSKEDVEKWLEKYCEANPKRSAYAFALDAKRPGYFLLLFKANLKSNLGCWHVKVVPNAYQLRDTSYPEVVTLCNGFKTMYMHLEARQKAGRSGGMR
ncbi:SH2 domain-containing protein [Pyronema domesticum]|nr:SH2 domain-containing protein [Pyronema domesticum]